MKELELRVIANLMDVNMKKLIEESQVDGFRFLNRLWNEYESGENTFQQSGEVLVGAFTYSNELAAIGGLNQCPFSDQKGIGRLRRFYVGKEFRRQGLGTSLLIELISNAKGYYKVLTLHTDTEDASRFYTAFGFKEDGKHTKSTHYLELE